ncbi:MAG: LptF/LptG family permease, partial [Bacteriovoracia bacterium]
NLYFYQGQKLSKIYKAQNAKFSNGNQWLLQNAIVIDQLKGNEFPTHNFFEEKEIDLNLNPKAFDWGEREIFHMKPDDLAEYLIYSIRAGINADNILLHIYDMINSAIICLIFTLIPITALFNPNRRSSGIGKSIFFTLVFSLIYWLIYSSLLTLGTNDRIPPFFAVFTTTILFLIYLYRRERSLIKL